MGIESEPKSYQEKTLSDEEIRDEIDNKHIDSLRESLKNKREPEEYIERTISIVRENQKNIRTMRDAWEKGGGMPEIQEAKFKVKDLEESIKSFEQWDPDDKETLEYMKTELKLWKRQAEGRSVEGETVEEKEEYRKHVGGMTKEEMEEAKKKLNAMKML